MKINISQKLALSAALVVSIVGSFSESAEAGLFRISGQSNGKQGSEDSVKAEFILDTDKGVIENFKAIDLKTENPLNDSFPTGATVTPSEFTENDRNFVSGILDELGQTLDNNELQKVVKYELTNFQGLPNYEAQLYIPFETESEKESLSNSLATFDNTFKNNPDIRIPGILIRDYIENIDGNEKFNQKFVFPDRDSDTNDFFAVDVFGIAGTGSEFTVEEIKNIPEPTTAAGLFAALAVGGFSLRKGDKLKGHGKSDRRVKSKAII